MDMSHPARYPVHQSVALAQLVERLTVNQVVVGSSPTGYVGVVSIIWYCSGLLNRYSLVELLVQVQLTPY